jgi:uncharacterized protein YjbI with pentapeptide repeats
MTSTQFSRGVVFLLGVLLLGTPFPAQADIYRWGTWPREVIPGTEGIEPGPGVDLGGMKLEYADLSGEDLTASSFDASDLTHAAFCGATLTDSNMSGANLTEVLFGRFLCSRADLTNVDFSGAVVTGTWFVGATRSGFTKEQLYSTQSYRDKSLRGIRLGYNDLTEWDFSGQDLSNAWFIADAPATPPPMEEGSNLTNANLAGANLTNANLHSATLRDADLTGAVVIGAAFAYATRSGLTKEQIYSTFSYQDKDLNGIRLSGNDLSDWDFSGQDLTNAALGNTLKGADLTGANLSNALLSAEDVDTAILNSDTVYNQRTAFPDDFDPAAAGLTLVLSREGDFDASDALDTNDIDWLSAEVRNDYTVPWWLPDEMFDLNADGNVDLDDHRHWVHELKKTWIGDANLDLEFNSSDMVQVFAAGKYEDFTGELASWSEGDWNGDGIFNSSDMVTAFADGGYEKGPGIDAVAVPEPASAILFLVSLVIIATQRRRFDH